ncbi:beta-ketoacyl-ACP reductase [Bordetella holmesii]|uniref:acetoacetyl-CoA reductase n=1 Tax=Bordetella holmesii TaxID=35814 RepID=UPI000C783758|nr:acetoacetyl-CoA reductase [Bordetella holmesii]AUL19627.1 beta-ketoacyl-ACP reductase [Bordetella holmesii]AUL50959.1 beta-ketoacyl-ACP reductase [Bordetella holmesii]
MNAKRTALVTGGMGALGQAIAHALDDAGHRVIVTCHRRGPATQARLREHKAAGREFLAYAVDVADHASCRQLAEQLAADGLAVDILVNNAGLTRDASLRKMLPQDWTDVLRTNLDSMFNMTQPFVEGMTARGWGRIVNISSSVNGFKGAFGQTNYAAAKAGIHGFTKSLALEVARKGVTVNTVSPGYLDSPMVSAVPPDVLRDNVLPQIPVGRLGKPQEIAALVAFICGDLAGFMTGSNVAMNGGQY